MLRAVHCNVIVSCLQAKTWQFCFPALNGAQLLPLLSMTGSFVTSYFPWLSCLKKLSQGHMCSFQTAFSPVVGSARQSKVKAEAGTPQAAPRSQARPANHARPFLPQQANFQPRTQARISTHSLQLLKNPWRHPSARAT